jgi:hypothetical protein
MVVTVEFNKEAFRFNISKEDIIHVLKHSIFTAAIEGLPDKYAVIGKDRAGNHLEVIYNTVDNNTINIFHAMKVRESIITKLGLGEIYVKDD